MTRRTTAHQIASATRVARRLLADQPGCTVPIADLVQEAFAECYAAPADDWQARDIKRALVRCVARYCEPAEQLQRPGQVEDARPGVDFDAIDARSLAGQAWRVLSFREREILAARWTGHTLGDVAREWRVTRERIRQIEQKAYRDLAAIGRVLETTERKRHHHRRRNAKP